jgi:hypothetical protein
MSREPIMRRAATLPSPDVPPVITMVGIWVSSRVGGQKRLT